MESYSVKAVLSALDKNFTSTMAKANLLLDGMNQKNKTLSATSGKVTSGFKSVAAALGVIKVASAAFNVLSNSMDKAVSRYDTLNRFPKVLQQIGFSAEDSSQAMKELSDGTKGLPTALDEVASTAQRIAVLTGNLKKATKTTIALMMHFLHQVQVQMMQKEDLRSIFKCYQKALWILCRGGLYRKRWELH